MSVGWYRIDDKPKQKTTMHDTSIISTIILTEKHETHRLHKMQDYKNKKAGSTGVVSKSTCTSAD